MTLAGDLQDRAPDAHASILQGDQVDAFRDEIAPQQDGGQLGLAEEARGCGHVFARDQRHLAPAPGATPIAVACEPVFGRQVRTFDLAYRPPPSGSQPDPDEPPGAYWTVQQSLQARRWIQHCGSPGYGVGDVGAIPPCPDKAQVIKARLCDATRGPLCWPDVRSCSTRRLARPCRQPQPRSYPGGAPHASPQDGAGAGDRGRFGRTRPPFRLGPAQPAMAADRRRS